MRTKTDREALDELALFMARPGQWNGGDVCELAADVISATGRPNPGDSDYYVEEGVVDESGEEVSPEYVKALAEFHAGDTKPRVEILHVRDPDSECSHEVWLDGVKTDSYGVEDIDPGRGWTRTDWNNRIEAALLDTSDYGQAVVMALNFAADSKWIEEL